MRGGNITATAAGGSSRIQVTSAEHNLYTGQKIVVAGITGGTGTQSVIRLDRNTFQLAGTTFGGSTQTGTWTIDRPTSFIQFGEPYAGFGAAGWNSAITNVQVVCNHDSATDTYAMLFLGTAQNSRIHNVINDQGGPLRPYLVENGAKFHYFTDWYLPSLPGGTDRLYQFRGFGVDYTPRLQLLELTSNPSLATLDDGQMALGVVGGTGKLFWRRARRSTCSTTPPRSHNRVRGHRRNPAGGTRIPGLSGQHGGEGFLVPPAAEHVGRSAAAGAIARPALAGSAAVSREHGLEQLHRSAAVARSALRRLAVHGGHPSWRMLRPTMFSSSRSA